MTDLELIDAQRLADALDTVEAGREPDVDPREDPSLASLISLASEIRAVEELATDTQRFHSYRTRSRDHILRTIEPEAAPRTVEEPQRRGIPFLRWTFLAPVASAAAAAVAVLAFVAIQGDSSSGGAGGEQVAAVEPPDVEAPSVDIEAPVATPAPAAAIPSLPPGLEGIEPGPGGFPPAASVEQELQRIQRLIATLAETVAAGDPVDASVLRAITESTASVAHRIENQPESVSQEQVITYIKVAADGRTLLAAVRAEGEGETALTAARRATQDGVVVASTFFVQRQ